MKLPEGVASEDELLRIIDRAITHLSASLKFGYYDMDDMMQEGRLFALEAIPHFRPDKDCSLEHFLRVHVRNRFINLRRDKMERRDPPCHACIYLNGEACAYYEDKYDCERWVAWVNRNEAKKTLVESFDNDDARCEEASAEHHDLSQNLVCRELLNLMEEELPLHFRSDYQRYLGGVHLPKARREKLESEIQNIVSAKYGKKV
jgi:DNA-directed RNA polymerase specialized sigma24 family protein